MKKIILLGLLLLSNTTLFGAQDGAAFDQQSHVPSLQDITTLSTLQMMKDKHPTIYKNPILFEEKLKENKAIPDSVKNKLVSLYKESKEITLEAARLWVEHHATNESPLELLRRHKPELARLVDEGIHPWSLSFKDIIDANGAKILASKIYNNGRDTTGFFENLSLTSSKGFQNIPGIIKINSLLLSNNLLTTIHPDTFNDLDQLYSLSLYNNELPTIHPYTFKGLKQLKMLYLTTNKLTEISSETFNGLDKLVSLCLLKNQLTKIGPDTFKKLTQLQCLTVEMTKLPKIHPDTFKNLTQLNFLFLPGNPLTQEEIPLIKSQVPANCRVHL